MANKKTLTPTSLPASLTLPEERKAEKALLFGLLASRKSLPEIAFRIRPEMFTHPDIALAIEAYLSLHGKGKERIYSRWRKRYGGSRRRGPGNCPTSSSWPGKTATWR